MAAGASAVFTWVFDIDIDGFSGAARRRSTGRAAARTYHGRRGAGTPSAEAGPALDGSAERHLVREFQVSSMGHAARDAADLRRGGRELAGDEEPGRLAV